MPAVSSHPIIHRHAAGSDGALVNAYLVEGPTGVVAIDSMLTVSDSRALREALEQLNKPLRAALLTHSHPDHYGGLTELVASDDVPIIAVSGVNEVIRRDDEVKEQILRPMFGDEWTKKRTFPNETVSDGDAVRIDGMTFTAMDIGPGESPHDSAWFLGADRTTVFLGDQVYNHMHAYLADGFHDNWLSNIERLRSELRTDATLHIGHGEPTTLALLDWQREYIETFLTAVREVDYSRPEEARAEVVARVKDYLPTDKLQFLMELSIDPVAARDSRDGI
jgi:glyoxylase-like metal-dependent hydrolase (beta-lactamase superfamily II)